MSVAPLPAIALPAAHAGAAVQTQAAAADVVVPIHLQLGNSAVNVVLGVAAHINTSKTTEPVRTATWRIAT